MKRSRIVILITVFLLVILVMMYRQKEGWADRSTQLPIGISDAHIVNMKKDSGRFKKAKAQIPWAERWEAVNGKEIGSAGWEEAGARPGSWKPGELGCWLSHKRLLESLLAKKGVGESDGHLILEDDLLVTKDAWDKWRRAYKGFPAEWDIVHLGKFFPKGERINEYLIRSEPHGNAGTFAYVIKHGSIGKVLERLQEMKEPIDDQMTNMTDVNTYIFEPYIIGVDAGFESTIR